jgi:hypothetical protein
MLGATSTLVDTHPGFTAVIECLPSLNQRRARPPKDAGTRRCIVTGPIRGWATRLGDIGRALGITAIAAGKLLELLGYRSNKHVTDAAVSVGCGVRPWEIPLCTMIGTWSVWSPLSKSAAQDPGKVADVLATAIASQHAREGLAARKRKKEEADAAYRREEEAVVSGLQVELRRLRVADPEMTLLTAVEFITPDPARRISLQTRERTGSERRSCKGSRLA